VRSTKKTFVRNNFDAQRFLKMARPDGAWWDHVSGDGDPLLCREFSLTQFNAKDGYDKPIYILTDGKTGSSSEMFLLRMLHHPRVRVVGDNSAGMEVFGNIGTGFLPASNITFGVGMNYRELEIDNFELKGYKPDIKCKDGQDAFVVALNDFQRQSLKSNGGLVR
jgi:C-terminal processing protease CtpA/Prc